MLMLYATRGPSAGQPSVWCSSGEVKHTVQGNRVVVEQTDETNF